MVIEIILIIIVLILVSYLLLTREEDYSCENKPFYIIDGKNISGTVYAQNPTATPGLGWIL